LKYFSKESILDQDTWDRRKNSQETSFFSELPSSELNKSFDIRDNIIKK